MSWLRRRFSKENCFEWTEARRQKSGDRSQGSGAGLWDNKINCKFSYFFMDFRLDRQIVGMYIMLFVLEKLGFSVENPVFLLKR